MKVEKVLVKVEKVLRAAAGTGGAEVDGEGGAKVEGEGVLRAAAMFCINTRTGMRRWMASGAATRREQLGREMAFGARCRSKSVSNMITLP